MPLEGVFSVLPTPFHPDGGLTWIACGAWSICTSARGEWLDGVGRHRRGRAVTESGGEDVLGYGALASQRARAGGGGHQRGRLQVSMEYSRNARAAGASAVMISPPRMAKLNSEAVVKGHAAVAEAVDIELSCRIIRRFPGMRWSRRCWPASLVNSAGADHQAGRSADAVQDIANSGSGQGDPGAEFRRAGRGVSAGRVDVGAAGVMTGFAFPEILVEIVSAFRAGDMDRAADVFYRNVPLMRFEFQEGIGMSIRKEMLRRRGAFTSNTIPAAGCAVGCGTLKALDADSGVGWAGDNRG